MAAARARNCRRSSAHLVIGIAQLGRRPSYEGTHDRRRPSRSRRRCHVTITKRWLTCGSHGMPAACAHVCATRPATRSSSSLTVVTIMGLVLTGLTTSFAAGLSAEAGTIRRAQAQQNARLALDRMRIDIHCASGAPAPQENPYGGFTLDADGVSERLPGRDDELVRSPVVHDPVRGLDDAVAALPLPRDAALGLRRRAECRRSSWTTSRVPTSGWPTNSRHLADAVGLGRKPLARRPPTCRCREPPGRLAVDDGQRRTRSPIRARVQAQRHDRPPQRDPLHLSARNLKAALSVVPMLACRWI